MTEEENKEAEERWESLTPEERQRENQEAQEEDDAIQNEAEQRNQK